MADRVKGPRRLGLVAFIVAVGAVVLGCTAQYVAGYQLGGIARYVDLTAIVQSGGQIDPATLPEAAKSLVANVNALTTAGFVVWAGLSVWAIIQGIVAIAQRRGRAWGVAALITVAVGYVLVQTAYTLGLTVGAAPFV